MYHQDWSYSNRQLNENAFVIPLLNAPGYDVFNPMGVMPEFTCDIGTKKRGGKDRLRNIERRQTYYAHRV